MKFDDVLRQIGEFGPYQKRVFFFASLTGVFCAFEALSVIFIFYIPPHRCAIPGYPRDVYEVVNETHALLVNRSIPFTNGQWEECHVYQNVTEDVIVDDYHPINASHSAESNQSAPTSQQFNSRKSKCDKWVFDKSVFESTISEDFNVVCDRSWQRATSNMLAELGSLVGCVFMGFISDRFGRKIPFYVGALVLIGGGFGIAFTQNMHTVNLCRFLMGIARISTFINAMVVGMEIVGPSTRKNIVVLIDLTWCLGEFLLLVFAHFIRNWRWLEIALSVPTVIYLAYWWLIPESPRWLASRGREQEAVKILEKIVHANNTQLPEVGDAKELLESEKTLSIRHTFRSRELIVRLLIVFCNLFVVAMVYYGMTLNITNLSGNVFVNFAISAAVETLGYVLPYFFLDRLGRKPVYIVSMLAAGTALVGSIIPVMLQAPSMVIMAISMVGRFFVCVCFLVMYLYGAELFPTVVRTSTMGVGLTFSRIGSIVSAYIADVGILVGGRFQHALPLVLMGTPAFLVGLLSLWLPETKGTPLPDTLDDVENTVVKRKCFGCTRSPRDVQELTVVEKNHEARPDSQGNSLSC